MDLAELERAVRADPLNLELRLRFYDARLAANLSGSLRDPVLPELPIPACLASLNCHFDSVRRRALEPSQLAAAHRFLVLTVGHIQAFELWRAQRVDPRPGAVVTAGATNRALRAAQRIRSAICREEEGAARIKRREDPGIDEFKSRLAHGEA
jgi:hypothetical protein